MSNQAFEDFRMLHSVMSTGTLKKLQPPTYSYWDSLKNNAVRILILLAVVVTMLYAYKLYTEPPEHESFVKVNGLQLELDCRPFFLVGFNAHDLIEVAMISTSDHVTEGGLSGRQIIQNMIAQASHAGLNSIRTWAHTSDPHFAFQTAPGVYNERAFMALDFVLETARRNGMKVILSFIDNWKYYNGVDQFVDWSQTVPARTRERKPDIAGDPNQLVTENEDEEEKKYETARHALFFSDVETKKFYKNHVTKIVNRVNRYNRRIYKEDTTIMAWDLINEPRCEQWMVADCPQLLQSWVEEMSQFVKQQDPNHLVTIGSEGFFKNDSMQNYQELNPARWASDMGQDFVSNNLAPSVDMASIHVWPDNWQRTEIEFQRAWILNHLTIANSILNKPLLIEEFGKKLATAEEQTQEKIRTLRDPVYAQTYQEVEKKIKGALAGTLFWQWHMPKFAGAGSGDYGIMPQDSTFAIISQHTHYINRHIYSAQPSPKCQTECWVADGYRSCKNIPEICLHSKDNAGNNVVALIYTSKRACCRPGMGAFENGCLWS
eukprot:TRINITY_DN322_c0_g1_i2.p2 TRINITY_DN322_c0_g1~~TRINITY_DN322_c0_g1_i2.p2  ORF type:complete len:584 (+),score=68.95 TRINITY_DN322_c0_g1_i2:113-1753(+)